MRSRALVLPVAIAITLGAYSTAGAQDSAPDGPASIQLAVIDAHIEGSGPWTSWFGAAPDRELVITVVNTGSEPIEAPELVLTFGKGANPTELVAPPEIGRLEPGEPTTVRVDLDLPSFAVGTYAVKGTFPGLATPVGFRAETSHIPWLALILPLLILLQLSLVIGRNRLRDRIHGPIRTSDPTLPEPAPTPMPTTPEVIELREETEPEAAPADLETIIGEELGAVFDEAFGQRDDSLEGAELRELILELAGTAAGRAAERAELTGAEREALDTEMADAVLAAFDLEPSASG
jgi:hypothetical protein